MPRILEILGSIDPFASDHTQSDRVLTCDHPTRYQIDSPDWDERVARSKFKTMANFGKVKKGHIVLQEHGAPIAFRNIKIREIHPK